MKIKITNNLKSDTFYLEERHHNSIYQNAKQDADYLKTTQLEKELNNQYEALNLSAEQQNIIDRWIDAIHAQECLEVLVITANMNAWILITPNFMQFLLSA